MKKIALLIGVMLFSFNSFASTPDIASSITKSFNKQSVAPKNPSSIIYGGQDISRQVIASANQPAWKSEPQLIG